ncbi:hypothetical protein EHO61_10035 [Leptospira fluminis]|uniref:Glycosyltransferase RgtA/B/C/D-like domain-containing protein n=1 Tax=Leptospira fluminis TaxID=2484979 RepID=A0A4R9GPC3_9LEPT|nr:hypothetical protein [Leptospira fluminis]TGK18783.1 hypothetical protein EHO61_10035 [Leptospira fluminis]
MPSRDCWYDRPLQALVDLHGTSPVLPLLHSAAAHIGGGDPYKVYAWILPLLHSVACVLFRITLQRLRIPSATLWTGIFLLNPLVFAFFRYPFYSTYLFFLSIVLLYCLWGIRKENRRFLCTSAIISLTAAIRPSWHLGLAFFWICWSAWYGRRRLSRKTVLLALFTLSLPGILYLKNLYLFDNFSASSWLGMNLARSRQIRIETSEGRPVEAFQLPLSVYRGVISEPDPLSDRYSDRVCLNGQDYHNAEFVRISKEFMKRFLQTFDVRENLKSVRLGFKIYLSSPSNYPFINPLFDALPEALRKYPGLDWFSSGPRGGFDGNLYRFVYPLLLILNLFRFFRASFRFRIVFLHIAALTFLYSFVDPFEANRMRFELEPFWYLSFLLAIGDAKRSFAGLYKKFRKTGS